SSLQISSGVSYLAANPVTNKVYVSSGYPYTIVVVQGSSSTSTVPSASTDVTATPKSPTKITVSWTASAGAAWYQVFNSTSPSGPFTKFGGTSGTSLVIWGLAPSTTYYFEVRATNTGGTSALSSPPVSATTTPLPPAPPTGVTATPKSSTQITVS